MGTIVAGPVACFANTLQRSKKGQKLPQIDASGGERNIGQQREAWQLKVQMQAGSAYLEAGTADSSSRSLIRAGPTGNRPNRLA